MSEQQETKTERKQEHIEKPQVSSSKPRKVYVLGVAFVAVLLLGASLGIMISGTTPGFPTVIEPGSMVSDADFFIFTDGANYYAKNGTTGAIDYFGADAVTVIQTAVNNGNQIDIRDGIYEIDPGVNAYGLLIDKSNLFITLSVDAIFKLKSGSRGVDISTIRIGDGSTPIENISIEGGAIDGNYANNHETEGSPICNEIFITGPVTNVQITMRIYDSDTTVIWILGDSTNNRAKNITISDCSFENIGEGIIWQYADYVRVERCTFNNVLVQDALEPALYSEWWTIADNFINGTGQSGIDIFDGAKNGFIENNILIDCAAAGINIDGQSGIIITDVLVKGNLIDGTTAPYPGIIVTAQANARISIIGNIVRNSGDRGIYLSYPSADCSVVGNHVYNSANDGITVSGSRHLIADNIVHNNLNMGIYASACSDVLITGNHVELNTVAGIYTSGNVAIISNLVAKNTNDGIYCTGSNTQIMSNVAKNNNQGNSANLAGIRVTSGENVTVIDNICYDDQTPKTQDVGIYIQNPINSLFERNRVYGNELWQILNTAGSGTVVRYNSGYKTEDSGLKTITGSVSTVNVDYILGEWTLPLTAVFVLITCNNTGAGLFSVTAMSAWQFIITFTNQPGANTWTFYWYAQSW